MDCTENGATTPKLPSPYRTTRDQHLFSWCSEFVHCGSVVGKRSRKRINEVVAVIRLCL